MYKLFSLLSMHSAYLKQTSYHRTYFLPSVTHIASLVTWLSDSLIFFLQVESYKSGSEEVLMTLKFLNQRSTQTVERKQKDGSKVTISCPDAEVAYKYMGGVDQGDQHRHCCHIRIMCKEQEVYILVFSRCYHNQHIYPLTT